MCKKNGNCVLTVNNRRRCQRCRYERCAAAGMRSDAVLNDDQKKIRFRKLLLKRQKQIAKQQKVQKVNAAAKSRRPQRATAVNTTSTRRSFDYQDPESDNSLECDPRLVITLESRESQLWLNPSPEPYVYQEVAEFYHGNSLEDHLLPEQESLLLDLTVKHEPVLEEEETIEAKITRITDVYMDVMSTFRYFCKIYEY